MNSWKLLKLGIVASFLALIAGSAYADTIMYDLDSLEVSHGSATPATNAASRPTALVFNTDHPITPSTLGVGGYVRLDINVNVNAAASSWVSSGNLMTVGLVPSGGPSSLFDPSYDGKALLWSQNNSAVDDTGGPGFLFNKQFFLGGTSGTFVFGDGALGGYAYDNLSQTAPLNGSFTHFAVQINSNGNFSVSTTYLDPDGVPISNLASIGSNPQVLTGTVDPNVPVDSVIRLRPGDAPANWSMQSSNSTLTVVTAVPEPSAAMLMIVSAFGLFVLRRDTRQRGL